MRKNSKKDLNDFLKVIPQYGIIDLPRLALAQHFCRIHDFYVDAKVHRHASSPRARLHSIDLITIAKSAATL